MGKSWFRLELAKPDASRGVSGLVKKGQNCNWQRLPTSCSLIQPIT